LPTEQRDCAVYPDEYNHFDNYIVRNYIFTPAPYLNRILN